MARRVRWSEEALVQAELVTNYLLQEWGVKVAEEFVNKLNNSVEILCRFPYIGKPSERIPEVRRILVTKHNALFYRIKRSEIYIVFIFDTRQDPKRSKY